MPLTKISSIAKVRALSTLLYLKEQENENYSKLKDDYGYSLYVNEFEIIKAGNLTQNFEKCDKLPLARSLLLANGHDMQRLQLICKISFDNRFIDEEVWKNALEPLFQKKQVIILIVSVFRVVIFNHC